MRVIVGEGIYFLDEITIADNDVVKAAKIIAKIKASEVPEVKIMFTSRRSKGDKKRAKRNGTRWTTPQHE
jgi:hypothetical protein